MIHKFLFFHTVPTPWSFRISCIVEKDAIGADIEVIEAALAQIHG